MRLDYDKNEYFMFRLPSENHFLLSPFEKADIFGKREGLNHSPHIKQQIDLDTRLLLGLMGISALMLVSDFKRNAKFLNLRENFRTVGHGRFEADDFIVKKN